MARPATSDRQKLRGGRLVGQLVRARQDQALSQADLAARAEVPLDTLRRLEGTGVLSPSFFLIAALAEALGASLDDWAKESAGG